MTIGEEPASAEKKAALASDALLAAIVQSSTDAIISKDLDSIIMSWNPAAERIFGFAAEEMIGRSIRALIPDELQHEEDMILAQIAAGKPIEALETRRLNSVGKLIPVSVAVSPVRNTSGIIIGASNIARDLREKQAIDKRLRETKQRFRLLADNISQLVWIADASGYRYWYNKRWYDYTGTTLEEMQGSGWQSLHHPDHVDRVVKRLQHCWGTGEKWEDIFPLRGADGEYRWFLSRAMPIRNKQGEITCWFGTNTDITEERYQRDQIKLLMREVNHRAKNMLSMIQALARRTAPVDHPEFVESFEERLKALAANQELLVNRGWSGVQMAELVRTQLYYVEDLVDTRVSCTGPSVLIKPTPAETFSMALHELATNAAKYGALSNDEGHIDIFWELQSEAGKPQFMLSWKERGGPPVSKPEKEGFGSTVINRIPQISLNAEVRSEYTASGFEWHLRCDANRVVEA